MSGPLILFAGAITLFVTGLAVLAPLWVRGGRNEVLGALNWALPLLAGVIAVVLLIALALAAGGWVAVTAGLGAASATIAATYLSRTATRAGRSQGWYRAAMTGALIISVSVAVVGLLTLLR